MTQAPSPEPRQAHIGGAWQDAPGGRALRLVNPDTEAAAGALICADAATVDLAVQAARAARLGWSALPPSSRAEAIDGIIAQITKRKDLLAQTISAEIGAPIDFSRQAQVGAALGHLTAIRDALQSGAEDAPVGADPAHRVRYEPIGVAGLITPWNWPLNQVVLKVGAALAAGCTVVLKPSEMSSRTALVFAEAMADLDLAPGVFNLVIGDGQTGAALAAHPSVDMVSFTGSTRAGRHVAAAAAGRLARSALELGGKSPNLLFEDCDLETAIKQGLAHCFRNSGQSCNAASRMLVARSIYEAAVEIAARVAESTPVGRPYETGSHLGPLVNRAQFERVIGFIQHGLSTGLRRVAGGTDRPEGLATGFYVRPTVFADVPADNALFQEEIFGPVLTMTPFDDEGEAIALANATPYGLAAYVQTTCPGRADRVAKRLQAGKIQVNGTSRAPGAPFGGRKSSGYGREAGLWGIRAFQDIKSISGAAPV